MSQQRISDLEKQIADIHSLINEIRSKLIYTNNPIEERHLNAEIEGLFKKEKPMVEELNELKNKFKENNTNTSNKQFENQNSIQKSSGFEGKNDKNITKASPVTNKNFSNSTPSKNKSDELSPHVKYLLYPLIIAIVTGFFLVYANSFKNTPSANKPETKIDTTSREQLTDSMPQKETIIITKPIQQVTEEDKDCSDKYKQDVRIYIEQQFIDKYNIKKSEILMNGEPVQGRVSKGLSFEDSYIVYAKFCEDKEYTLSIANQDCDCETLEWDGSSLVFIDCQ